MPSSPTPFRSPSRRGGSRNGGISETPSPASGLHTYALPPLNPTFSSLPWYELEQQGHATRAWCRVDRDAQGGFGLGLNDSNIVTLVMDPLCTVRPYDTIVAVDGENLEGLLCEELEGAGDSIVLTVLRPTRSLEAMLAAAAKLTRRRATLACAQLCVADAATVPLRLPGGCESRQGWRGGCPALASKSVQPRPRHLAR